MAERITIRQVHDNLEDLRQKYEAHMENEQPWMQRVNDAIFGVPGDPDRRGIFIDVQDTKKIVGEGMGLIKWAARAAIGAAVTVAVTSIYGCVQRGMETVYTPPPPQNMANTLSAGYATQAALTARPIDQPTPTAMVASTITITATPRPTLTPWEPVEVTPCTGICESLPPLLITFAPPGVLTEETGHYWSWKGQRVRKCASLSCAVQMEISAGFPVETVGIIGDYDGSQWVCMEASTDSHGAQLCTLAAMWIHPTEGAKGSYLND